MNIRIETNDRVVFSLWFDKDKREHDLGIYHGETSISIERLSRTELEELRDIIDLHLREKGD